MKTFKLLAMAASLMLFSSCNEDISDGDGDGNWVKVSDYEGDTRTGAVSFVIGDFAYVGLGTDGDDYFKDFWRYDPTRNFWEEVASFPGVGRISAVAFAADGNGYVGTGFNEDLETEELGDFWKYDPSTNEWSEIAPFGGSERYSAAAFSLNGQGYVGTGYDGSFLKDFWRYDPGSDSWTQTISLFGSKRESAIAFVIDDIAYVGSGRNNGQFLYDFWSFQPEADSWEELSIEDTDDESYDEFIDAMGRYDAVAFVMDDIAYITTGLGSSYLNSTISYDPVTNLWDDDLTAFEGEARGGAVAFTINNQGYVTTGRSTSFRHDDIWLFNPDEDYEEFD